MFVSVRRPSADRRTPAQFPKVAVQHSLPQTTRNDVGKGHAIAPRKVRTLTLIRMFHAPSGEPRTVRREESQVHRSMACVYWAEVRRRPPSDNEGI